MSRWPRPSGRWRTPPRSATADWRGPGEVRRFPAFALVGLPKALLPVALRHQHVDHLNARRVQTLMHVHGSGRSDGEISPDDPHLVDLDALAADETERAEANVA